MKHISKILIESIIGIDWKLIPLEYILINKVSQKWSCYRKKSMQNYNIIHLSPMLPIQMHAMFNNFYIIWMLLNASIRLKEDTYHTVKYITFPPRNTERKK